MNNSDERDYDEEQYLENLCPLCDQSPCIGGWSKGSCEQCHCGNKAIGPDSSHWPYRHGMCAYCADVRCDAFPGACRS